MSSIGPKTRNASFEAKVNWTKDAATKASASEHRFRANASAIMPALAANGVRPTETRIVRGTKAWAAAAIMLPRIRKPPSSRKSLAAWWRMCARALPPPWRSSSASLAGAERLRNERARTSPTSSATATPIAARPSGIAHHGCVRQKAMIVEASTIGFRIGPARR